MICAYPFEGGAVWNPGARAVFFLKIAKRNEWVRNHPSRTVIERARCFLCIAMRRGCR